MSNRLINEQSPYLLQHAHNPVDWYPWGEEAFELAKSSQKPLIVSIGYSACHWCHVMERESFENAEVAAFMNENFVCVKVDREEYPDVDDFYMTAIQALTGSGGWPLNVFVTPDKLPFYGGTYFPPVPAHGRPSWRQVMQRMVDVWQQRPDEVERQANQMFDYLKNAAQNSTKNDAETWSMETVFQSVENLLKQADKEQGGFGRAPKFPGTMSIQFLLEHYRFAQNVEALQHALFSLDKMITGGIYDQIAGGFARYSVDDFWLVPHFEKMLYDNAMLINVLVDAYKLTDAEHYAATIRQTIAFLLREMRGDSGGFYSALDADSEGVEGKYYTWTYEEWMQVMITFPSFVAEHFGVEPDGNWEHTNILHQAKSLEEIAASQKMPITELKILIKKAADKLFAARQARVRPGTDDKVLLSWNALLNTALSKASEAFVDQYYQDIAVEHMAWMLTAFEIKETPKHVWKNGKARIVANLDDIASLVQALIQLSQSTQDATYLYEAQRLCVYVEEHFSAQDSPLFYYSSDLQNEVPLRKAEIYDGVTPSSNALMAHNLHLLGMLLENNNWISRSEAILSQMRATAMRYPSSFGFWNIIGQRLAVGYKTIVVNGEDIDQEVAQLKKKFWPECYYFFGKKENFVTMRFGKQFEKKTQIFICTKNSCLPPLTQLPENIDFAIL